MLDSMPLKGRVALVVGGAGGLGSGMAEGLCEAGAAVAVADIRADRAEDVAASLRDAGYKAMGIGADITRRDEVEAMVGKVAEWGGGRLDVLVNSAGITHLEPAETFPEEVWDRVLAINLKGVFLCSQAAGRVMLAQGAGSIINLSSIAGVVGLTETVAYCASKGGVIQITRALAMEWANRGVRVNALAPSWFETDMGNLARAFPTNVRKRLPIPIGRMGKPDEIKGAVIFLASDAAAMVTGHVLPLDGGYLAQ